MSTAVASGQKLDAPVVNGAANAGPSSVQYEVATPGTTTSTSYTATLTGSSAAGGTFVAPPTGRVMVHWFSGIFLAAVGSTGRVSWELRTGAVVGSGTLAVAADHSRSLRIKVATASNADQQWGASYLVTGLAAGDTYNIRHMFLTADVAVTMTISNQRLIVTPAH